MAIYERSPSFPRPLWFWGAPAVSCGGRKVQFLPPFESVQMSYKVGPLPVITVVITPISRVFSPQVPIYFRPFIGVISPFINGSGAHLVQDHYRIGLVRLWLSTWQGQPSEAHTAGGRGMGGRKVSGFEMYLLEPTRTSFKWMDMVISNHFSHGKDFWFIHPIDSQPFIIWMFQVPGKNQYHSITLKSDEHWVSKKKQCKSLSWILEVFVQAYPPWNQQLAHEIPFFFLVNTINIRWKTSSQRTVSWSRIVAWWIPIWKFSWKPGCCWRDYRPYNWKFLKLCKKIPWKSSRPLKS